ncbi:putative molybdenum cofactor biosynthesis protein A [Selenomonas ruminantium subsp. lactilytica TAM6421]|uniref:GTP 3',8-cyclase n=1 Tax=Selenomonas ruminantium subsp. lactilytica (strain NBRC 103574 / TAM6421) TaxID=927704 RepID=I0GN58_SELRL|nr:GTP 3',8-cyclase MoaA [Selenomonas ruminantium]BAL82195.1 putative molybdenum cofactor biosynthesis protein A [Selenomonas ruminantium subsp. lactilytica TAM6421]
MLDQYERKIEYVRISLTDRCNLRCRYCMPEEGVAKLRHEDILTFAEILRVVQGLASLGVKKVRLTGGEPLVRRNITELIREIRQIPGIEQVVLTTNGVLLLEMGADLVQAGLTGLNISLDTLKPETFSQITRRPLFARVQAGVEHMMSLGLNNIKFNCVPIYEVNDGEIPALAALARDYPVKVRFIELMPIGCAYEVGYEGVPMDEVRARLAKAFGSLRPVGRKMDRLQGPAEYYKVAGFKGQVGFIDAMEHKFCHTCNRVRLTAEGFLKLCLNQKTGLDLRELMRNGISDENLKLALRQAIYRKPAEHLFTDRENTARDSRAMYQVGG